MIWNRFPAATVTALFRLAIIQGFAPANNANDRTVAGAASADAVWIKTCEVICVGIRPPIAPAVAGTALNTVATVSEIRL